MSQDIRLAETDTINTDGTITRLLCPNPACETPVRRRLNHSANPGYYCPANCGKANPNPSQYVPANVTYSPVVRRVVLEIHNTTNE